jgi:hypothetical protein
VVDASRLWRWTFSAAVVGTIAAVTVAELLGASLTAEITLIAVLAGVIAVAWGWERTPWGAVPKQLAADPVQRRLWLMSTVRVAGIAIAVAAALAFVLAYAGVIGQPTFTCSTTDARACSNTKESILSGQVLVFGAPLAGRLVSVDVRPIPSDWDGAVISDSDWGALLTVEGRNPVLVPCYYSSDDMVACAVPGNLLEPSAGG